MAPEQVQRRPLDRRTDVYSLACLLYESLTAQPPFPCDDVAALCFAHVFRDPPRPSEAVASVPPGLDDVVARGMAKDPDERYATPGELAEAAWDAVHAPRIPRPRPPGPAEHLPATDRPAAERPGRHHSPGRTGRQPGRESVHPERLRHYLSPRLVGGRSRDRPAARGLRQHDGPGRYPGSVRGHRHERL
jgi:serine/threonine protein kinase